jgi:hypothetical protein
VSGAAWHYEQAELLLAEASGPDDSLTEWARGQLVREAHVHAVLASVALQARSVRDEGGLSTAEIDAFDRLGVL